MGMLSRFFGRSTSPDAIRAASTGTFDEVGTGGYGRYQNSLWGEATSSDSRIPHYRTPSPLEMLPDQRRLRSIVRHLVRTNPRIRPAMIKKVEIVVGSSVKPKSRFKELNDLFLSCCDDFDTRGKLDFAGLIADLVWNLMVDGDAALKKRVRRPGPAYAHLNVPIQFQSLMCDWMPDDYEGVDRDGFRYVHGVAIVNNQVRRYAVYSENPTDAMRYGRVARVDHVDASEVYHVFRSSTGVPRGETPLAAAISTAEDLADLMAFAAQRCKNMTAMATFLEQAGTTIDAAPPIMGETDTKRSSLTKWMQNLFLRPGDTVLLPPGIKANTQAPAGDMPGHDTTVRIETMVLCAIIGVPYHQATSDWKEAPERAMRFAGADLKSHVTILRRQIEHQCLRKLWKDFVKVAQTVGAWTPPPGATEAEIYATEWQWPVIQQATLDRELNVMSAMVAAGQLPPSILVEDYFGIEFADMTRRYAYDAATATANGMLQFTDKWKAATEVAKRILAEAEAREAHERDLVDQAKLDRSVLGSEID